MNIEGLGEKQIMDLIDEGILKTYSDLFTNLVPNKDKITELDGWGEKSFNVIISGVEKAKKQHWLILLMHSAFLALENPRLN